MSQFLNYITKKQKGGDISSLPGVLSLSSIQKDIKLQKEKKAASRPSISKWNPKPGEMERLQQEKEMRTQESSALLNRLASNEHLGKFVDNIVEPMMILDGAMALGKLPLMLGKGVSAGPREFITRGHIDWGDAVNYEKNSTFNPRFYENTVKDPYVPPTTDPSLAPKFRHQITKEEWKAMSSAKRKLWRDRGGIDPKKKGGPIVDPRGQWAHPGKDTIIPTEDGKITMQGVPYPVYGQDETGYGQMMMPGGEYSFPGKTIYEKPIDMFNYEMAYGGQMITRKDGSKSKRGLWDNIRANKGSGKKPTKEMLEQESRIRALEEAMYGMEVFRGGGTFSGNMYYQDGGGYESLADYAKASGRGYSFKDRKVMAEDMGISGYKGTAAQNRMILEQLMREDAEVKNISNNDQIRNPETNEVEYENTYGPETSISRQVRLDDIRAQYDSFRSSVRQPAASRKQIKQAAAVNQEQVADPTLGNARREQVEMIFKNPVAKGKYNGPTFSQRAGRNPYINSDLSGSDEKMLRRIDNDPRSQKNIRYENAMDAIGFGVNGASMITGVGALASGVKSLPGLARLIRMKTLNPMGRNVGSPLMEELTLQNVFSSANKFMPSVRQVVARAKYDAAKLKELMKTDKKVAKLLKDAAEEEEILMSGVGTSRKVFKGQRAAKNMNDLYERSGFATGGPVEGDEIDVTPQELEMLRQQGYQFEII